MSKLNLVSVLGMIILTILFSAHADAQLLNEGFDLASPPALPAGWAMVRTGGHVAATAWTTTADPTFPITSPHSAPNVARFNSHGLKPNNAARLYMTSGLDLTPYGCYQVSLSFWMYHDSGSTRRDRVQVQVSTNGGSTWASLGAPFLRYLGSGVNQWRQHTLDLTAFNDLPDVRIGFAATSARGNNIFLDDVAVSLVEIPAAVTYTASAVADDSCTTSPSEANNDHIIEPGEAASIDVDLTNSASSATATGVSATLTTSTPGVTVTVGTVGFPDIPACERVTGLAPFEIQVDPAVACGSTISFDVTVTWNTGSSADSFTLPVGSHLDGYLDGEDFDGTLVPSLPADWTLVNVNGTSGAWATAISGSHPAGTPPLSAPNLGYFASATALPGDSSRLQQSLPIDMTDYAGWAVTASFWMFHDVESTSFDRVQLQVSTDGSTWSDVGLAVARFDGSAGWKLHSFDVSDLAGQPIVYFGLLGVSAAGNDCHVDDFSVTAALDTCYCDPPQGIYLLPAVEDTVACNGVSRSHRFELWNASGWDASFPVTYSSSGDIATNGPTLLTVEDRHRLPFDVDLTPGLCSEGETIEVTVTVAGHGFQDSATISTQVTSDDAAWSNRTDLPSGRHDLAAVAASGGLYAIGGDDGTGPLVLNQRYDLATGAWTQRAPLPAPLTLLDGAMVAGEVFIPGGSDGGTFLSSVWVYDPTTDSWALHPQPAPRAVAAYGAAECGGLLYRAGGAVQASFPKGDSGAEVFDPASDTWSVLPAMIVGHAFAAVECLNGKLVVAGGIGESGSESSVVEVYDPTAGSWSAVAPLPAPRWGGGGLVVGGMLLIAGGVESGLETGTTLVYDPTADTWAVREPLEDSRFRLGATTVDGVGFAIGGMASGQPTASAEELETCPTCQADLVITKDDGVTGVTPGGSVTYTIGVSNLGPANVIGASVEDQFPAELTGVSWSCTATGGATCTAGGVRAIVDTVDLPAGSSITYTGSGTVVAGATGTLDNTATVTPSATVPDPDLGNNSATDSDAVGLAADLSIAKTDGATSAVPGTTVTYTVAVSNSGPSTSTGATVSDVFPASLTGATWTCVGVGGGSCTASGAGNISDSVTLPVGASVVYTATAMVNPAATGTLVNTATVTAPAGTVDPVTTNNSATDSDNLTPSADLTTSKDDGLNAVNPGQAVTYVITVANAGPSSVTGATVTDLFPAKLTGVTWTCAGAGGATCTASGVGNIADSVTLPVGATVTYTAGATVSTAATGLLVNTASVAVPAGVSDPVAGNNSASDTDVIVPILADLRVTTTDGVCSHLEGEDVVYSVTVVNEGPSEVTFAPVTGTLPAALSGVTWTCSGTGGGTCTPSGTGDIDDLVALPPGATVIYTISGTVTAGASGWLLALSTAMPPAEMSDPDMDDNLGFDLDALEVPVFCDAFDAGTTGGWSHTLP